VDGSATEETEEPEETEGDRVSLSVITNAITNNKSMALQALKSILMQQLKIWRQTKLS
jgi:hypothetical protein